MRAVKPAAINPLAADAAFVDSRASALTRNPRSLAEAPLSRAQARTGRASLVPCRQEPTGLAARAGGRTTHESSGATRLEHAPVAEVMKSPETKAAFAREGQSPRG